jgi:site-specific DNA recombinase
LSKIKAAVFLKKLNYGGCVKVAHFLGHDGIRINWRSTTMNRSGKKCVLYPRVSTEMQVDGFNLDGQKNSLKRFVIREEMEIVDVYEDAGKSGKSIDGRPAFKQMLCDIENGLEIDYILVYKLSRFGRNAADILNSLERG